MDYLGFGRNLGGFFQALTGYRLLKNFHNLVFFILSEAKNLVFSAG